MSKPPDQETLEGLPSWGIPPYDHRVVKHPCGGLMVRTPYAEWLHHTAARLEAERILAAAQWAEEHDKDFWHD